MQPHLVHKLTRTRLDTRVLEHLSAKPDLHLEVSCAGHGGVVAGAYASGVVFGDESRWGDDCDGGGGRDVKVLGGVPEEGGWEVEEGGGEVGFWVADSVIALFVLRNPRFSFPFLAFGDFYRFIFCFNCLCTSSSWVVFLLYLYLPSSMFVPLFYDFLTTLFFLSL